MALTKCHVLSLSVVLSGGALLADFIVSENLTLTQDLEWQYRGKMTIADNVTIDLAGYKLYVGEMAGNGSITSTAAGDPAELHVVVPVDKTYGNATVGIHGNLRLFKDGYGTFAPTKTGNDYSGGTEVTAGLFKAWTSHYPALNSNGALKGVFVGPGAFFDFDGAAQPNRNGSLGPNNWFTLCGGTMCNRASDIGTGWSQVDHVRLTDDSTLECRFSWGLIGGGYGATDLNLAGRTLHVDLSENKNFYLWNTTVTAGVLTVGDGQGTLHLDKTSVRADEATLDLNAGLSLNVNATFGTVISRYAGNSQSGEAMLYIKNRFQPVSEYLHNFQLKNGATLDLSERTESYSIVSTLTSKTLSFENNAAITVDVAGRILADGEKIVSWTSAPNATFVLDASSARAYDLTKESDGLTVTRKANYVAAAVWTGAGDVADPTDPGNWSCTDAKGEPVAGCPGPLTDITVGASVTLSIPFGTRFHCKSITGTGALATDCDWRGLVRPNIVGTLDLAGFKLRLSDLRGNGTITDSTTGAPGELHIDVPAGKTATNTDLAIVGNVRLVKDGEGLFNPTRNPQTGYNGGTEIVAGTFKARHNRYSYNNIVVREGARFDLDPYTNSRDIWELPAGPYTLDGGELYHAWQDISEGCSHCATLNLTADSRYVSRYTGGLIGGGYGPTALNLNGHVLDIDLCNFPNPGLKFFYLYNTSATKGTIRTSEYTILYVNKNTFNGPETTLDLAGTIEPGYAVVVSNVIVRTVKTVAFGGQNINIRGTFTPVSDWLHNFVMQDGTTLDLNRRFDPFKLTSPLTGKTLAFDNGATVTVDVHGRTLVSGEVVVEWNAQPSGVSFQLDAVSAAQGKRLYLASNGLCVYQASDIVEAQWTAAVDGDFAKPGNWICKDASGHVVADALPTDNTFVWLPGSLAIDQMKTDSFPHRSVFVDNATLTTDADWTDVDDTLQFVGTLDLAGHKLSVSTLNGKGVITDTSTDTPGELHMVVPENVTGGNSGVRLTGNLKFVKEGSGLYAPVLNEHDYTGGTEVAGGTMKALTFHYDYNNIIVDAGATLDIDGGNAMGHTGTIDGNGWLVLNGGVLVNQTADVGWAALPRIRLWSDSTLLIKNSIAILAPSYDEAFIDLNGNVLTFDIAAGKNFGICNCTMNAGTLKTIGEGSFKFYILDSRLSDTSIDLGSPLEIEKNVRIKDLTVRYAGKGARREADSFVEIAGVYTPLTDYMNFFKLLDGATLDLNSRSEPFALTSSLTGSTLSFADNATVIVDVHERVLANNTKLVSWETPPENLATVKFRLASSRWGALVKKSDGLYLQRGFVIMLR